MTTHTTERASSRRAILGVSALLFVASAAATILTCRSMGTSAGMPMPGGWTISMVWMRMPGQSWAGAAATFLGIWTVMMVAMMLPSLVPALWRYRESVGAGDGTRVASQVTLVGVAYFSVWILVGAAVFPLGVALAAIAVRQPAFAGLAPLAAGVVIAVAGSVQLTAWKARHLACWREGPQHDGEEASTAGAACRYGVRLGLRCGAFCAGPMAILLVAGIMDLRAMAVVTAALTAERLAPAGGRVARATGVIAVGIGLFLVARIAGVSPQLAREAISSLTATSR